MLCLDYDVKFHLYESRQWVPTHSSMVMVVVTTMFGEGNSEMDMDDMEFTPSTLHYAFNSNHYHWVRHATKWLPFEHIYAGIDCKLIWQWGRKEGVQWTAPRRRWLFYIFHWHTRTHPSTNIHHEWFATPGFIYTIRRIILWSRYFISL